MTDSWNSSNFNQKKRKFLRQFVLCRKIFWTDWDRKNPKIEWANSDGSGREIFTQAPNIKLPNSLVIDFDLEQLCYADAGTKSIECMEIDTKQKYTLAVNCTYPFGITVTDKHIYYSDWIS